MQQLLEPKTLLVMVGSFAWKIRHLNKNYESRYFSVHRPKKSYLLYSQCLCESARWSWGIYSNWQLSASSYPAPNYHPTNYSRLNPLSSTPGAKLILCYSESWRRQRPLHHSLQCQPPTQCQWKLMVLSHCTREGARRPIADSCISNATLTSIYLEFIVSQQTISRSESWWFCRIAGKEEAAFSADTLAFQSQTALLHSCSTCTVLFSSSFLF